ncbi:MULTISPECIES: SCO3242 family prenyltransferase [Streptomyces]|uniref:SCO3242 family prenyltransferase n=1 Tax=Streptomyces TaxID=1883 RepID=UPI000F79BA89|nr:MULTISPECIES: UbiA family prenyltransferase [unclassified Streptomyces]MBQ0882871.1 UbiA family prenyltransferase [Streptomyces sp. RT42]QCR50568.1 prenyltransferase [Streptomyces sp. SGAir0924]RSS89816.1 prenyltransferase [Streptomyces sp. WAC02707]
MSRTAPAARAGSAADPAVPGQHAPSLAGAPAASSDAASRPSVPRSGHAAAWAELLRLPALFTVPGDALAGAAAAGARPGRRTLLAIGSSLCLYEAGMALNDWADRAEDAVERPHRPLPSGRVRPAAALTAAGVLTGAGLALAAGAGRPALAVAAPLAATVWAYDLGLKHTPAGPVAMAAARGLDLLLGAAATGGTRAALPSAALLGSHTLAVTAVSRRETTGGSVLAPLAALATTGVLTRLVADGRIRLPAGRRAAAAPGLSGSTPPARPTGTNGALTTALAAAYAATAARPYVHAALNPSPPLTQRAVGGGIRATVPLQAALAARAGAPVASLLVAALAPAGRMFARRAAMRKVSIT